MCAACAACIGCQAAETIVCDALDNLKHHRADMVVAALLNCLRTGAVVAAVRLLTRHTPCKAAPSHPFTPPVIQGVVSQVELLQQLEVAHGGGHTCQQVVAAVNALDLLEASLRSKHTTRMAVTLLCSSCVR